MPLFWRMERFSTDTVSFEAADRRAKREAVNSMVKRILNLEFELGLVVMSWMRDDDFDNENISERDACTSFMYFFFMGADQSQSRLLPAFSCACRACLYPCVLNTKRDT